MTAVVWASLSTRLAQLALVSSSLVGGGAQSAFALSSRRTGKQYINLDTAGNSPLLQKWNTRRLTFQPLLSFTPLSGTPAQYISQYQTVYSGLNAPVRRLVWTEL